MIIWEKKKITPYIPRPFRLPRHLRSSVWLLCSPCFPAITKNKQRIVGSKKKIAETLNTNKRQPTMKKEKRKGASSHMQAAN